MAADTRGSRFGRLRLPGRARPTQVVATEGDAAEVEEILENRKRGLSIRLPRFSRGESTQPLSDRFAFLRADSPVPVYIGIVIVMGGFALIGVTWGKVAALLNPALQFPYMVSGGLTGLGLIMVGITVISIAAKRRDAAERARQLDQLGAIMNELRSDLRGDSDS